MIYISYPMYFDALNTIIEFKNRKNKNLPSFWPGAWRGGGVGGCHTPPPFEARGP